MIVNVRKMDSARSWFHKFQPRDRLRASTRKKDDGNGVIDDANAVVDETDLSNVTKQKVAAAKQYIENHYKEQMKNLQERKERYIPFHSCSPSLFAFLLNYQFNLKLFFFPLVTKKSLFFSFLKLTELKNITQS